MGPKVTPPPHKPRRNLGGPPLRQYAYGRGSIMQRLTFWQLVRELKHLCDGLIYVQNLFMALAWITAVVILLALYLQNHLEFLTLLGYQLALQLLPLLK